MGTNQELKFFYGTLKCLSLREWSLNRSYSGRTRIGSRDLEVYGANYKQIKELANLLKLEDPYTEIPSEFEKSMQFCYRNHGGIKKSEFFGKRDLYSTLKTYSGSYDNNPICYDISIGAMGSLVTSMYDVPELFDASVNTLRIMLENRNEL